MFFIRRKGQYWTGKKWADDCRQATVYNFAAEAIANFPCKYADDCAAVGLTAEQWDEIDKGEQGLFKGYL